MSPSQSRTQQLQQALSQRILILDGAMGTMVQTYKLQEADYLRVTFCKRDPNVLINFDTA